MEMTVSATELLDNVTLFWSGIEAARKNFKQTQIVGFSNIIELNETVKVEFWNQCNEEGDLSVVAKIPGLGYSGDLNFGFSEVQEEELTEEYYGNHLLIFINSLGKILARKAYDQWCEETNFIGYVDQLNTDKMTDLLPKGFALILEPEVRGYDLQVFDSEEQLLYRAAGENVLEFEEDTSWDKLKLEIKLAWMTVYVNGLAFKDLKVVI